MINNPTERKVAMISQPMRGLTKEEVEETNEKARRHLERLGYVVAETYISNEAKENPIYCLSLALEHMAQCDAVYFCDGWENYTVCGFEHMIAEEYGLDIIYQEKEKPLTSDEKAFLDGIRYAHDKLKQYSSEELGTILSRMEGLTETTEERLRAGELYYLGDRCE